jgi:hypothetical protein
VVAAGEERKRLLRDAPGPSLGEKRTALSLVAFLGEQAEFQGLLPQVFLSNEHLLTEAEVDELNLATADNVFFVRRKSSWVNNEILVKILRLLKASLGKVADTHRIVLSMDVYKAHLHVNVVRECAELGFFLHFVPASLTKWLQPLDIVVFKRYKEWVATETEKLRVLAPGGRLSKAQVFSLYAEGVHAVLEGEPWTKAFELAGLMGQTGTSTELLNRLGCYGPVCVPKSFPSAVDLLAVYPRRSRIPVDDLFSLVVRTALPQPAVLVLPKRARLSVKTRPPSPCAPAAPL